DELLHALRERRLERRPEHLVPLGYLQWSLAPGQRILGRDHLGVLREKEHAYSLGRRLVLTQLLGDPAFQLTLRALEQLVLLALRPDDEGDDAEQSHDPERDVDRRAELAQHAAEEVVEKAVERGPDDRPGGVEDEESRPRHLVRAREKRRPCAEDRDE